MERILRILILVAILGSGGAILRRSPLIHRYGGPNKRPAAPPPPFRLPQQGVTGYPPPGGQPIGGGYGPPQGQTYGSSYNSPSPQNYGVPRPNAYNAPPSGPPRPSFDLPSVSYTRPFGLPQPDRFPNSGHTYKLPKDPPPRIPMKSNYQSKPYPDYIVRFKPQFPSELTVVSNQQPSRPVAPTVYSAPPTGPTAIYAGKVPAKSPIPIIDSVGGYIDQQNANVGINVGTSYQTGNNGQLFPSSSPPFGISDQSSQFNNAGSPPSTSIYVLTTSDFASDKLQNGETGSSSTGGLQISNQHPTLEFSKDENSFGATAEPGVVRPLTPDVVYRPDSDFKPLTLIGPVFFPKGEGDSQGSSSSATELKETSSLDTEVDCSKAENAAHTKCLKSAGDDSASKQLPDSSPTVSSVASSTTTEAPSSTVASAEVASGGKSSISDSVEAATPVKSKRPKSKLRLFRIINGIKELITGGDDESEGSSRVDEEDEELEAELAAEEEEASQPDEGDKSDHREDSDVPDDTASETGAKRGSSKRRQKNKRKSSAKQSSSGNRDRNNRPRRPVETAGDSDLVPGLDVREDELRYVQNREQFENSQDQETLEQQQFQGGGGGGGGGGGFMPGQSLDDGRQDSNHGGQDPILGPVSVGYIGPPPTGSNYHNLQPFFYPSGIPVYPQQGTDGNTQSFGPNQGTDGNTQSFGPNQGFEADHTQRGDNINSQDQRDRPMRQPQEQEQKYDNTRRHFDSEEPQENDVVSRDQVVKQSNSDASSSDPQEQFTSYDGPFSPDTNNQPSNDRNNFDDNNGGQQNYGPKDQGRDHYEDSYDNFEAGSSHQPSRVDRPSSNEKPAVDDSAIEEGNNEYHDRQNDVVPPPANQEDTKSSEDRTKKDTSTDSSYATYPETNSYSVDSDVTETTAYADHASAAGSDVSSVYNNDYDQPAAQTTSYLHVDQDIAASATDSAISNTNVESNADVAATTQPDHGDIYTNLANQNEPLIDNAEDTPVDVDSAVESVTPAKSYAVVSRRPFPSFSRFRGGYRFKNRDSDVPITTYRPAAFRSKDAADKSKYGSMLQDKQEEGASLHNSLSYDPLAADEIATTASPNDLSEPVAMDSIRRETMVQSPEQVNLRFGSRLSPKQTTER